MTRWCTLTLMAAGMVAGAGCEMAEPAAATGNGVCDSPLTHVPLPAELEETSGVAASRAHPGVFWTHNDSGGDAVVFAVDSAGALLARVRVRGATNRDWEDIAIGPCEPGGGSCLFVADIGDNSERHDRVAFYRVPEPDPATDSVTAAATVIRARYPGGPRDAEALFVTAAGIHVINKGRSHAIDLFRLAPPYSTRQIGELQRLQQVAPPPTSVSAQVTAAAASPDERHVVVRSYSGLRFFQVQDDTLAPWGRAADLVVPQQMQGEGVGWIDQHRLVLTSEAQSQRPPSIAVVRCDPRRPPPDSAGTRPAPAPDDTATDSAADSTDDSADDSVDDSAPDSSAASSSPGDDGSH